LETEKFLRHALSSRADQTFLWVNFVLQHLEESLLASKKDFQKIIDTLPRDLESIYERFLQRIPDHAQAHATKLLHLLIASSRQLTLAEVNIAFTIQPDHRTSAELQADCQPAMAHTLHGILGPFARISASKVSLVHQSAKEFLLELALRSPDTLAGIYGINPAKAALILASTSIHYLLLEDFAVDQFSIRRPSLETGSIKSLASVEGIEVIQFEPFDLGEDMILKDQDTLQAQACATLTEQYEFFDYAATHWAEHLSACETIAPQALLEAVARLTEKQGYHFSNWFKYMWFKRELDYTFPKDFDAAMVAAFFNLPTLLQNSLQRHDSYDQTSKDRALFWSCRMGCVDAAAILLRSGADPNSKVVDRQTPLGVACQQGYFAIVEYLLAERRTDVNLKGKLGRSALSFAAGNGHPHVVQILLNNEGCRPDEQDDSHWTPLFWAVGGNHMDIIAELLIKGRSDVNHCDRSGRSVISWAAGDGLVQPLKYLLKYSLADPNLKDSKGRSPLSWAAGNGQVEAVNVLMRDHRVEKSSVDLKGRNAISWACGGGHESTLRTLIKYSPTGIDDIDVDGWTPLAWALNNRSLTLVEVLMSTGAVDIERQDLDGRTPLLWAASYGYAEVVQYLLSEGATAKTADKSGQTPLGWAQLYGHLDVINELLASSGEIH
jgi:ankyrin repeat protein